MTMVEADHKTIQEVRPFRVANRISIPHLLPLVDDGVRREGIRAEEERVEDG